MKPGIRSKDSALTFNQNKMNVLKKDIVAAQKQEKKKRLIDPKTGKFLPKDGIPRKKEVKPALTDAESAYQMLQDMRWVYQSLKGRDKLKKMVKDDDKQFVFMVKELMKIESALMAARVKKDGGDTNNQQNFFVVLKGLEDEQTVLQSMDKTVDMKQIQRAINPDESSYEPEEEIDKNEPPEMLLRNMGDE